MKPTHIDKDYNLTDAENLKNNGYDPEVYIILKDGAVVIDSCLNCWDDDLSYWENSNDS